MTPSRILAPILLCEPDPLVGARVQSGLDLKRFPLKVVHHAADALDLLSDRESLFSLVVINADIEYPFGLRIIRKIHQLRSGIPILLQVRSFENAPFNRKELGNIGLATIWEGEVTAERLQQWVEADAGEAAPETAPESTSSSNRQTETPGRPLDLLAEGDPFVEVQILDFLSGRESVNDIFVRISVGKYLQVFRKGEPVSIERIKGYRAKGHDALYVRQEDHLAYLKLCDELTQKASLDESIPLEKRFEQTAQYGDALAGTLIHCGFEEKELDLTRRFTASTHEMIARAGLDHGSSEVKRLLGLTVAMEHVVATSMIAALLVETGIFGEEVPGGPESLGLACFLHDIELYQLPEYFWEEDPSEFNATQSKIFQRHPEQGAERLSKLGLSSEVVEAVRLHHQRLGKAGFPPRPSGGRVNRLAELVGFSDDFSRYLQKAASDPLASDRPIEQMSDQMLEGFSERIVDAFRAAFQLKPSV